MKRKIYLVLPIFVLICLFFIGNKFYQKDYTEKRFGSYEKSNNFDIDEKSSGEYGLLENKLNGFEYEIPGYNDPTYYPYNDTNGIVFKDEKNEIKFFGFAEESKNPGSYIYLNGEKIGESDGAGISNASFSEGSEYFVFETVGHSGIQVSMDTEFYFVDLKNKTVSYINKPKTVFSGTGMQYQTEPYIEKYEWISNSSIRINFFFIDLENVFGKTYRVSPIEVWEYNLDTGEYNFIETLPEGE